MRSRQIAAILFGAISIVDGTPSPQDLALRMLASIEQRGQSTLDAGGSTGFIQLGLFWRALVVATEPAPFSTANDALRPLLASSLESTVPAFVNVSKNAQLPLDRFSLASDMISSTLSFPTSGNSSFLSTIINLNDSLALQSRNANGGLWYYNNVANLTAYQNLSYLDGMYSFAPYITILSQLNDSNSSPLAALESALEQVQLLHDICVKSSGLLVHGYDALKAHAWANISTGASPEVWGRSLAWYSLGLLNTLEVAAKNVEMRRSEAYETLRSLFQAAMQAQAEAAEHSKIITGVTGVWQVVDRPGEAGNFVEASSSFMTAYTLLRGIRLDFLSRDNTTAAQYGGDEGDDCADSYTDLAAEIYQTVSQKYLVTYANGSLSLNGTSSVASLSPQNVSYEYYVTRPWLFDSLIGTSAFAMASYEMAQLQIEISSVQFETSSVAMTQ